MEYMHTMIKVRDLDKALDFYTNVIGLTETKRMEVEAERCTVVFLAADEDSETAQFTARFGPNLELLKNWDDDETVDYSAKPYGHLGYRVDNIYETCARLMAAGFTIQRPPRDGFKAFVKTPEGASIELIQRRPWLEPAEPWKSMPDQGTWND